MLLHCGFLHVHYPLVFSQKEINRCTLRVTVKVLLSCRVQATTLTKLQISRKKWCCVIFPWQIHPFHMSDTHLKFHELCGLQTGSSKALFQTLALQGFVLQWDHLPTKSSIYVTPSSICSWGNIHQHMPC